LPFSGVSSAARQAVQEQLKAFQHFSARAPAGLAGEGGVGGVSALFAPSTVPEQRGDDRPVGRVDHVERPPSDRGATG
jgi:hypothetical protein